MPERPKKSEHDKHIRPRRKLSKASKVSPASIHRVRDTNRTVVDHRCHLSPTAAAQTVNNKVNTARHQLAWSTHHRAMARYTTSSNTQTHRMVNRVKSISRVSSTSDLLRSDSDLSQKPNRTTTSASVPGVTGRNRRHHF